MFIVDLEHIATGYPKQIEISLYQFVLSMISKNKFANILGKSLIAHMPDFEYDYFYKGTRYVNVK